MSLGIVVLSPSGIVLAADSRVTLNATNNLTGETLTVNYDNATKLLRFNEPNKYVGAVTWGQAIIPGENRTAESYVPEFEASLKAGKRYPIQEFAKALSDFFVDQWKTAAVGYTGPEMIFQVAGYDDKVAYGHAFQFTVPQNPTPVEHVPMGTFSISWGGQTDMVDRMIRGFGQTLPGKITTALGLDPAQQATLDAVLTAEQWQFPIHLMPLQDCVSLVLSVMRGTVAMQQLAVTLRGVGGPIDLVTITRTVGLKPIQLKEVYGDDRDR